MIDFLRMSIVIRCQIIKILKFFLFFSPFAIILCVDKTDMLKTDQNDSITKAFKRKIERYCMLPPYPYYSFGSGYMLFDL